MKNSDTQTEDVQYSTGEAQSSANVLTAYGSLDLQKSETELRLSDGRILHVPTAMLLQQSSAADILSSAASGPSAPATGEAVVIPLIEEQLEVGKRVVTTGRVLLEKDVQEYHETLDESLAVRTFDIERSILNRPIDSAPPAVRHEGDITIYSLVEEQLVLTKQLILKEEVRVKMLDTERRDTRTVTLKRESLNVTRVPVE